MLRLQLCNTSEFVCRCQSDQECVGLLASSLLRVFKTSARKSHGSCTCPPFAVGSADFLSEPSESRSSICEPPHPAKIPPTPREQASGTPLSLLPLSAVGQSPRAAGRPVCLCEAAFLQSSGACDLPPEGQFSRPRGRVGAPLRGAGHPSACSPPPSHVASS